MGLGIERLVRKCKELGLDPDEIIPFWISEVRVSRSGALLAEKYGEGFWRIFKEFPEEPELRLTDEQLEFYNGRIREVREPLEKAGDFSVKRIKSEWSKLGEGTSPLTGTKYTTWLSPDEKLVAMVHEADDELVSVEDASKDAKRRIFG